MWREKNCLIVDDDHFSRLLLSNLCIKINFFSNIFQAQSVHSCLETISKERIDVVFLDIHMPEKSGLEIIPFLKKSQINIVIVSSDITNAFHGFENNLLDFILKPPALERLQLTIKKFESLENNISKHDNKEIFVKSGKSRTEKISVDDICFVESIGNHVGFYLNNNKRIITTGTLKAVEEKISGQFIRIHNSYLVRLDKITAIEGNCVIVNKKALPVSRSNRKLLEKKLVFL